MKKLNFFTLFFVFSTVFFSSHAQDFAGNFLEVNKNKQADFSVVNVTSAMLKMIAGNMDSDPEVKTMIQNIKGIRRITAVNNSKNYYSSAKNSLAGQYEELVSVDNSEKNVRIFIKGAQNNIVSEVVMLMLENNIFTLIDIAGKIDLNQLSKLSTIISDM